MKLASLTQDDWTKVLDLAEISLEEASRFTRVTSPILLSSPVVACLFVDSTLLSNSWSLVGYVSTEIFSGLTIGGAFNTRLGRRQPIYANRLQIFTFPLFSDNYSLVFDLKIVGNVQLQAWEYTGEIN